MLLLAALLSFGWPALKTEWVPANTPCPQGMFAVRIPACCGSMRPYIHGGETAYAESYHGQPLVGEIVATPTALHQVTAETADAVLTAGTANRRSDGWTPKAKVRYILRYIVRP